MSFAKYLFENNYISAQNFIDAYIEKRGKTPNLLQILRDSEFFSEESLIKAIIHSLDQRISILKAVEVLELVSPEQQKIIESQIIEQTPHFFNIILEQGFIDIETAEQALSAYRGDGKKRSKDVDSSEREDYAKDTNPSAALNSLNEMAESEHANLAPSSDQQPELKVKSSTDHDEFGLRRLIAQSDIRPEFLKAFRDIITIEKIKMLHEIISNSQKTLKEKNYENMKLNIRNLLHEIHLFKGASRLINAKLLEFLLIQIEQHFESVLRVKELSFDQMVRCDQVLRDGVLLTLNLVKMIFKQNSEQGLWDDREVRKQAQKYIGEVKNVQYS